MVTAPVQLWTDRLHLRRSREDDRVVLERLWTDPHVRLHLGGPISTEELERRRAEAIPPELITIELRESRETLGFCSLTTYRGDAELTVELDPAHEGKEYAAEACTTLLRWAFAAYDLPRVVALPAAENTRFRALLERLGMRDVEDADQAPGRVRYLVDRGYLP